MTSAGIELATFRFVVQNLNHCATSVPVRLNKLVPMNCFWKERPLFNSKKNAKISFFILRYATIQVLVLIFLTLQELSNIEERQNVTHVKGNVLHGYYLCCHVCCGYSPFHVLFTTLNITFLSRARQLSFVNKTKLSMELTKYLSLFS